MTISLYELNKWWRAQHDAYGGLEFGRDCLKIGALCGARSPEKLDELLRVKTLEEAAVVLEVPISMSIKNSLDYLLKKRYNPEENTGLFGEKEDVERTNSK